MRRRMVAVAGAVALAAGTGLVVLGGGPAGAAACTPATTADDGSATSLRGLLEDLGTNLCDPIELTAGATYLLDDDGDGEIDIDGPVTIEGNGATIQQTDGDDNVMETSNNLTLRNVTVTGGRAVFGDGGGVEVDDSEATLRLEGATITDNATFDDAGGGIHSEGPVVVINSTISNNEADNDGGGIVNEDVLTVTASTISGNCAEDDSGAIDGDGNATLVNSTVTNNISNEDGAIGMDGGDLVLVYSDIVSNTLDDGVGCAIISAEGAAAAAAADPGDPEASEPAAADEGDVEPANVDEASNLFINEGNTLFSFGSVIARPLIGAGDLFTVPPFNCEIDGSTDSSGYNFSDDDTCEFTNTATGDRENAGDPGLGALANNGGPTQTLLPTATSPLVNFIPLAACGGGDALAGFAVTTDQRGITRPQATGCEIGSVEIQVIVAEPTFTG